jgi:hypothetical protein
MKNIKTFENYSKVNEGAGLILGGVILAGLALPGFLNWASNAWTKFMMERKFKPTGEVEMVPFKSGSMKEPGEIKFEGYKDDKGQHFWGVTFVDGTVADPGYENHQYFLFNDSAFAKVKQDMAKGEFNTSGSSYNWSKTPDR